MLEGAPADTPEVLMRSRYTAYVVGDLAHLMRTTHPDSPHYGVDRRVWMARLREFSEGTEFRGLDVQLAAVSGEDALVQFHATLWRDGHDVSFTERSRFRKVAGVWLYLDGEG